MMAGDVAVNVLNGDLRITGDGTQMTWPLFRRSRMAYRLPEAILLPAVTAQPSTASRPDTECFTGVSARFQHQSWGASDDRVTLGPENDLYGLNNQVKVPRDLLINAGSGNNIVLLNGLFVARNASISSGNATDRIFVHANVQNDLTINTGGGNDLVDVCNTFVRHNLTIDASVNNTNTSDVTVYLTTMNVGNDVNITTGGGKDSVYITDIGVNHDLAVHTGGNDDYVSISR